MRIPSADHEPGAQIAEVAVSRGKPGVRSGEESVDQEPDRHPSGDRERSEDDKESSQLATRRGLDLGRRDITVGDQGPAFHAEVGDYARERGIIVADVGKLRYVAERVMQTAHASS